MAKDFQDPSSNGNHRLLDGRALRIGIVVSRFNNLITNSLLSAAQNELEALGVDRSNVIVTEVPGAFELPQAAQIVLANGNFDAIICLGCVIRGETSHYDYICSSCATGLQSLSLQTGIPIVFGVLTTENLEQAKARCGGEHGNKGIESAKTAVEMALLAANHSIQVPEVVKVRAGRVRL